MRHRIERVFESGDLIVFKRCWNELGMRRYVVGRESDGRMLEEFSRRAKAVKWARENGGGHNE